MQTCFEARWGWCQSRSWTKAVVLIRSLHGHGIVSSGKHGRLSGSCCEAPWEGATEHAMEKSTGGNPQ
eukprot:12880524-Prorocentrum_lima.AAC.1